MELVGVLPLVVIVCALLWQAVVTGQAVWLSGSAARAAARAAAVGGDRIWRAADGRSPRDWSAGCASAPATASASSIERAGRARRRDVARVAARAGFPEQSP